MSEDIELAAGLIAPACEKYASQPLVTHADETHFYGSVFDKAGTLAAQLHRDGLEQGDRVGLLMSNRIEYFIAALACLRGGLVTVPMSDLLSRAEHRYFLPPIRTRKRWSSGRRSPRTSRRSGRSCRRLKS